MLLKWLAPPLQMAPWTNLSNLFAAARTTNLQQEP